MGYAHSGRTNSAGCHTNSETGDYHCHNSPAPRASLEAPSTEEQSGEELTDSQIR
ncbi:MAG: hypothetical protein COA78_35070 [Blastopirellula sp.]|nr:MAG: hypothetical protein COA78_35070 [Blastopirellula sp.]